MVSTVACLGSLSPGPDSDACSWDNSPASSTPSSLTVSVSFALIALYDRAHTAAFVSAHSPIAGWRWCFIICGLLGLIVSALIFFLLPDWPDSPPSRRQFLSQEEGAFMASRLPPGAASSHDLNFDWLAIKEELKSPLLCEYTYTLPLPQRRLSDRGADASQMDSHSSTSSRTRVLPAWRSGCLRSRQAWGSPVVPAVSLGLCHPLS